MIANFTPNDSFSIAEKFLVDKLLELFFNRTLDSHRAKLNNPHTILIELHQVLTDWDQGKIKAFDRTVKPLIVEVLRFLEGKHQLLFEHVSEKYYKQLLNSTNDKSYELLTYSTKIVIEANRQYLTALFKNIGEEICHLNSIGLKVSDLDALSRIIDYLATELVSEGLSKSYLYSVVSNLFSNASFLTFATAWAKLESIISREEETFTIVFRLNKLSGGNQRIDIKSEYELDRYQINDLAKINAKAQHFFSKATTYTYFLAIKTVAKDYISVIEKAKKSLFALIDFLHMGYPDNPFDFSKKCLVIGTRKRHLANIQPVFYIADGSYKNNEDLYDLLSSRMKELAESGQVQKETLQKIVSAFRYLRLGRDADELEQKFLNYWIGLEYVFSSYDVNDSVISRLKEFFVHSHSIAYIKRNLTEFHNDIVRLKLQSVIPGASADLGYLQLESTYDFIIDNYFEPFPLLAFRAYKYRSLISGKVSLAAEITKHRQNLEWHLTRCYRIRNEIVHDAAIHLNIELVTGNLKYYLTYILNGLIDYLSAESRSGSTLGVASINDFFLLQKVKFESYSSSGFALKQLMAEKSATEIFSK